MLGVFVACVSSSRVQCIELQVCCLDSGHVETPVRNTPDGYIRTKDGAWMRCGAKGCGHWPDHLPCFPVPSPRRQISTLGGEYSVPDRDWRESSSRSVHENGDTNETKLGIPVSSKQHPLGAEMFGAVTRT